MARTATVEKEAAKRYTTPVGRLINNALFERDQFDANSKPSYKIELALDPGEDLDYLIGDVEDWVKENLPHVKPTKDGKLLDIDGGPVITMFLDGDRLAAERESRGKKGDAYKGKTVIRANTIYNRDGVEGPGGAVVYDEEVTLIEPVNARAIYNGCMGVAGVTIASYEVEDRKTKVKDPAVKFYLVAFQKTGDGEKLTSPADHSSLFKPVGRPAGAAPETGRRKRAG